MRGSHAPWGCIHTTLGLNSLDTGSYAGIGRARYALCCATDLAVELCELPGPERREIRRPDRPCRRRRACRRRSTRRVPPELRSGQDISYMTSPPLPGTDPDSRAHRLRTALRSLRRRTPDLFDRADRYPHGPGERPPFLTTAVPHRNLRVPPPDQERNAGLPLPSDSRSPLQRRPESRYVAPGSVVAGGVPVPPVPLHTAWMHCPSTKSATVGRQRSESVRQSRCRREARDDPDTIRDRGERRGVDRRR